MKFLGKGLLDLHMFLFGFQFFYKQFLYISEVEKPSVFVQRQQESSLLILFFHDRHGSDEPEEGDVFQPWPLCKDVGASRKDVSPDESSR